MSRIAPIIPLIVGNNGGFAAVRSSPAQGSCGTHAYPCKHPGLDVRGAAGTPVRAPESGTVLMVADGSGSPFGGYGPWVVVIAGDSGKFHLLGHLDPAQRARAPVGLRVNVGDVIGTTSSANHTHWEVRSRPYPNFSAGEDNWTNNSDPQGWLSGVGDFMLPALIIIGGAYLAYLWRSTRH